MLLNLLIVLGMVAFFWHQLFGRRVRYPKGPMPFPILGSIPKVGLKFDELARSFHEIGKEYGGLFTVWMPAPWIVITDFEIMKEALVTHGDAFAGRPEQYIFMLFAKGKYGLVGSDGALWREQRRFALHTLRDFGFGRNIMEQKITFEVERLVDELQVQVDNAVQSYDAYEAIESTVSSIIGMISFGHRYEMHGDKRIAEVRELMSVLLVIFSHPITQLLNFFPFLGSLPFFDFNKSKILDLSPRFIKFFDDQIEEHLEYLKEHPDEQAADYTNAYLQEQKRRTEKGEDNSSFTKWQLLMAVSDLWSAGSETTVTTLTWGLLYMCLNMDIQERAHNEIVDTLGSTDKVTMADRTRLPFVSCCLIEVQRLANILPLSLHHETTLDVTVAGQFIPKGTIVMPQIWSVNMDERVFPDASAFRPARFLTPNSGTELNQKLVDHVVPFSMGKRQCLGESLARMELNLIFITLLQKFKFELSDEDRLRSIDELMTPIQKFTAKAPDYKMKISKW